MDSLAVISQMILENNCCVFDSSDHPGVDSSGQIEKFQEKALMELQDYVQKTYPDDTYRYIHTSCPTLIHIQSKVTKNVIQSDTLT